MSAVAPLPGNSAFAPQRAWLVVGAALAALAALYAPSFADMARIWTNSSTFNHCFLIPAISALLFWERREQLAQLEFRAAPGGVVMVAAASLLWWVGELLQIAFFQHVGALSVIIGGAWALAGNEFLREFRFPLFYLYFAVPEGEFLMPTLQDITGEIAVLLVRASGIPVFVEGLYLTLPSGMFVIAEACSGINYLIATLAVGTLFAYRAYATWPRRLAFMGLAIVVPILANGLRAYGIIMIAHLSDHKYAVGIDHIIYGWVFFGLVIVVLFAIGNTFSDAGAATPRSRNPATAPSQLGRGGAGVLLAVLAAAAGGPVLAQLTRLPGLGPETHPEFGAAAGWIPAGETEDLLLGKYAGATQHSVLRYRRGADEVTLDINYYRAEAPGSELLSSVNTAFRPGIWQRIANEVVDTGIAAVPTVRQWEMRSGSRQVLVWFWYDVYGTPTVSRLGAKVAQARARLGAGRAGLAAFAAYTPIDDLPSAATRLRDFVQAIEPHASAR